MYVSTQNAEKYESAPSWRKRVSIFLLMLTFSYAQLVQADGLGTYVSEELESVLQTPINIVIDIIVPLFPSLNDANVDWGWKYKDLNREVDCLAKNIYFEAGYEPYEGKVAVGLVTINRVKAPIYPKSICEVVWQQNKRARDGKRVAQFSWTMDGKPDVPRNPEAWQSSLELAREMLDGGSLDNFKDFTNGATHYHATYVHPGWRRHMEKVVKIGLHIFYRDPKQIGSDA